MSNPIVRQEPMASNANLNHFPGSEAPNPARKLRIRAEASQASQASRLAGRKNPSRRATARRGSPHPRCCWIPGTSAPARRRGSPASECGEWHAEASSGFAAAFAVSGGAVCLPGSLFFILFGVPMKWALGVWLFGFRGFWFRVFGSGVPDFKENHQW